MCTYDSKPCSLRWLLTSFLFYLDPYSTGCQRAVSCGVLSSSSIANWLNCIFMRLLIDAHLCSYLARFPTIGLTVLYETKLNETKPNETERNETKRTERNKTIFQTQFYINDSYHFLLLMTVTHPKCQITQKSRDW